MSIHNLLLVKRQVKHLLEYCKTGKIKPDSFVEYLTMIDQNLDEIKIGVYKNDGNAKN